MNIILCNGAQIYFHLYFIQNSLHLAYISVVLATSNMMQVFPKVARKKCLKFPNLFGLYFDANDLLIQSYLTATYCAINLGKIQLLTIANMNIILSNDAQSILLYIAFKSLEITLLYTQHILYWITNIVLDISDFY